MSIFLLKFNFSSHQCHSFFHKPEHYKNHALHQTESEHKIDRRLSRTTRVILIYPKVPIYRHLIKASTRWLSWGWRCWNLFQLLTFNSPKIGLSSKFITEFDPFETLELISISWYRYLVDLILAWTSSFKAPTSVPPKTSQLSNE